MSRVAYIYHNDDLVMSVAEIQVHGYTGYEIVYYNGRKVTGKNFYTTVGAVGMRIKGALKQKDNGLIIQEGVRQVFNSGGLKKNEVVAIVTDYFSR